jgi:AcrR family transcriptional regulator
MMLEAEKKLDPRMKRTRQLIQQALLELMKEKHVNAITVQDITERATVNRATFYDHFEDKYALLEYCFRDAFQQVLHSKRLENSACTVANLQQLVEATCEFLLQFGGRCAPANKNFDPQFEIQITRQLYDILRVWLSQEAPHETPPELRASVTSWAIYGAAFHWKKAHHRLTLDAYVRQVMPMIVACMESSAPARQS